MIVEMNEPKITPLARRLAEENGIDWRRIQGTGPEGEITERDILNFLAKVMSGEITLEGPPPGEPPPLEGEADLDSAREKLEKEGVDLDALIPEPRPSADTTPEFELDLDLVEDSLGEEPLPPRERPAWSEQTLIQSPLKEEEPEELGEFDFAPEEVEEEAPEPDLGLVQPPPPEPEPEPEEPEFDFGAPEPEPEEVTELEVTVDEVKVEEPEPELELEPEPEEEPVAAVAAPPPPEPAEPPPPPPREVPVAYLPVLLSETEAMREEFSRELGREVPREALLFLAARRALADLEVPLRPLKGRLQVPHAAGFAEFLKAWSEASDEGEGLSVAEASPPVKLAPPALVLATQSFPEGQGILILLGDLGTDAERFLERVAHYLEKPVRLLLLG